MKKGKTSQLRGFDNVKCSYGTVDSKDLKTVYVILQSWVEPKKEVFNWKSTTGMFEREIKHILLEVVDQFIFEKHYIVDMDLRSSGIQIGKRSFMNLEITLYLKSHMDFKSIILKDRIKRIVDAIYSDVLICSTYFTIHKTKKPSV